MRKRRGIIFTVIAALVVTLGFAYMTNVDDPIRPYWDYGMDEPERTLDRGPGVTGHPIDGPPSAEPSKTPDPYKVCESKGLEWDGTQCYQPQLPEEIIGRVLDGPNGETCVIVDVEGHMSCNLVEPGDPPVVEEPLDIPPATCE